MKIKTTNNTVLEQATQHIDKSIELLGCDNLCDCDTVIKSIVLNDNICSEKNTLAKTFGFNNFFFYNLFFRFKEKDIISELGLAKLRKKNKKIFLDRKKIDVFIENDQVIPAYDHPYEFYSLDNFSEGMLLISHFLPNDFKAYLSEKNCIICSNHNYIPSTLKVEKNSVIGRNEKGIESIKIVDLLSKIIKYDTEEKRVKFFNGSRWINLVEDINEDTK